MKRGDSGLSLVVAVNKPTGMTSHDVVNRCRKIFGERRVGHTGTLDPLARGVLPICIGPATRLDRFATAHDKRYRVTLGFGYETTTDDIEGSPTVSGDVSDDLAHGRFAADYVSGLVGTRQQVPPSYSAVKVNGKKAYELARQGKQTQLAPRTIEVIEATLVERKRDDDETLTWTVDFTVSKGTYIRALVRDMGRELGCPAHVRALERLQAGAIGIDECMTLETIETLKESAAIDPVKLLGFRFAYVDGRESSVSNGMALDDGSVALNELNAAGSIEPCPCFGSAAQASEKPPIDGELVSLIAGNRLCAIYQYQARQSRFAPSCVFSIPVSRG